MKKATETKEAVTKQAPNKLARSMEGFAALLFDNNVVSESLFDEGTIGINEEEDDDDEELVGRIV
jgi:hypothetical protein